MAYLEMDLQDCRVRQRRLLEVMAAHGVDVFVSNQHENVQWLTGVRFARTLTCACAMRSDGHVLLIAPHKAPERAAADDIRVYPAKWHSTMRNDQALAAAAVLGDALGTQGTCGVEFSSCGPHWSAVLSANRVDLEPALYRLRRRKEADELKLMRVAIGATERMYEVAREMIAPGVNELDVFNALQAVAVRHFGEMLTGTGNDYQCNARGGAPRDRPAQAGELYILDLGPAYRGYYADNARTIAVSDVSQPQHRAWEQLEQVFGHIEHEVKPGVSCKKVFEAAQQILDESPYGVFNHHLGHGVGLFPHEAPHLNPNWDDYFEVGDVFAAEPGLYDPELLRAGMRIENNYRVTETGLELLTPFSRTLHRSAE